MEEWKCPQASLPLCALALALLAGCGVVSAKPSPASPAPSQTDTPPPEETTPPAEPSPDKSGAEYAYFLVFEHLFSVDPGLNGGINYLAVDLSSVCAADTDAITRLFEDYCKDNNLTLLLDTYAGLVDKGYIVSDAFEDGLSSGSRTGPHGGHARHARAEVARRGRRGRRRLHRLAQ